MDAASIRIGISGWRYEPWRKVFYPRGLAQRRELHYASRQLPTIEINGTFHSLQRPDCFSAWRDDTPEDFVLAVKGSRYLTHMLRLKDPLRPLANFFASGIFNLRHKLGPFLWQLPPSFAFDAARLEAFFELLPRDLESAARLARRHDERVTGGRHRGLRLCSAPRRCGALYERLVGRRARGLGATPARVEPRRGGGGRAQDRSGPRPPPRKSRDVYCCFDNDAKVHAPFDARRLIGLLEGPLSPGR